MTESAYRPLPSVDAILRNNKVQGLLETFPHNVITNITRDVLTEARLSIKNGGESRSFDQLTAQIADRAKTISQNWPNVVINATGVILHTNLGRSPLSHRTTEAATTSASLYSDVELSLSTGKRGNRNTHISNLIAEVTESKAGIAVNNNAAGVLLTLAAIAGEKQVKNQVIVSRGESVEIGGGFRIPDVMRQSGATLVEVGTTNRTYTSDYESAINSETAAILKVHPSNFVVDGFTHAPELKEIVAVGKRHGVPVLNDLGSGCLIDTRKYGLKQEPQVQSSISDGATLTLFSGDKLIGGPQAGLIAGEQKWIDLVSKHPLARAVRIDKVALSAISATLVSYLTGTHEKEIPIWTMIALSESNLADRSENWRSKTGTGTIERSRSTIGGGSLPGQTLPTSVLSIDPAGKIEDFVRALRESPVAVVARIENNRVILDPRTVLPDQDDAVIEAIKFALNKSE
ncbi:MAG: L-seryl-tRNA(Sec) selenium transferase [Dehalococcoidia bacterium]|nr:L-seryl-tRNA(Sec) selenium transferase [Dehalococcoidia bacterium]